MEPHGGELLRNLSRIGLQLAPVEEAHAEEFDVVHVADADETAAFIDPVDGEFEGHRLHQAVLPALPDFSAGEGGNDRIAGRIDHDATLQREAAFVRGEKESHDPVALLDYIIYSALQVHIDACLRDPFGQDKLGFLHVVGLARFADPVVAGDAEQRDEFVAHRPRADRPEDRPDEAGGQVAADHAVAFDQRHAGAFARGCDRGAEASRPRPGDQDVIGGLYLDFGDIMHCIHLTVIFFQWNPAG